MQLARMDAPHDGLHRRTVAAKLVQAFRALQIEGQLTKREILVRYLARVPFGGTLRGVGAAAHAWFGKRAADLTAPEAALLVSMLPAPTRFRPDRDPEGARARRDRVLDRMRDEGFLDDAEHAAARATPLGLRPTPFPDVATHAWLQAGDGPTGIDPALQRAVEEIVRAQPEPDGPDGVAVLVVDNATLLVRALAGAREPDARLLDATRRPRSAGSTLKPLLFALAFDAGLAAPDTRLLDLPWATRDWAPGDFDRTWRGPVPAARALADSLNVPAIRLAAALPPGAFAGALRAAGFAHVRAPSGPGIDLAIGTDDATVFELAGLYAALANGGAYAPVCVSRRQRLAHGGTIARPRVCSRGAADLVTRALADPARARPAGAARRGIAWKTGTSSRRRDAWAAGYTARFTIVVWRGRLDGAPHPDLVGARHALPLFFAIAHAADPDPAAFAPPRGVVACDVCAITGLAAGPACRAPACDLRPADAAPLASCDVHVRARCDATTGALCCASCEAHAPTVVRDLALFAPALADWRRRAGLDAGDGPAHRAGCPAPIEPAALRPVFDAPRDGQVFVARSGDARVACGVLSTGGEPLELLLDGRRCKKVVSGGRYSLDISAGNHTLTALDGGRRSVTIRIAVLDGDAAANPPID
jgi:penicillin-binding protein 1C